MMPSMAIVAHVPSPLGKGEKVAGGRKRGLKIVEHSVPEII